jgi:hypothetical protein
VQVPGVSEHLIAELERVAGRSACPSSCGINITGRPRDEETFQLMTTIHIARDDLAEAWRDLGRAPLVALVGRMARAGTWMARALARRCPGF